MLMSKLLKESEPWITTLTVIWLPTDPLKVGTDDGQEVVTAERQTIHVN